MKHLLLTFLLLGVTILTFASTDNKVKADSFYAAGRYAKAAELYEQILKEGDNATLYYNLGNAYYRMHDMARAILNYERAANREPGDSDIRFNLSLARSKTIDKIESTDDFFLVYGFRSLVNSLNTDEWGRMSVLFFAILLTATLLFFFGRKLILRKIGFGVAIATFVLVLVFNVFAYLQRQQYLDNTHAIVMQTVKVKSTPADSGTSLFELHEGSKVQIIDKSMRDWVEIRLPDGKSGWLPNTKIEMI